MNKPRLCLQQEAQLSAATIAKLKCATQVNGQPQALLLTGATGFLGAYVLQKLLSSSNATIYCLVRGKDAAQASRRLTKNLKKYNLYEQHSFSRIKIIVGDISQQQFAMESSAYDSLCEAIDAIYHMAADVNILAPYEQMKPATVIGTENILTFACSNKAKTLHYISSMAVFYSSYYKGKLIDESNTAPDHQHFDIGYAQSKWVAEQKVQAAKQRGLPTVIYRIELIFPGLDELASINERDFITAFTRGVVELGIAPKMQQALHCVPIEYVSDAIVTLAQQADSIGKIFHLVDPYQMTYQRYWQAIQQQGYSLAIMEQAEWIAKAKQEMTTYNPIQLFFPLLEANLKNDSGVNLQFDCNKTMATLNKLNIHCPKLDSDYIARYLPKLGINTHCA